MNINQVQTLTLTFACNPKWFLKCTWLQNSNFCPESLDHNILSWTSLCKDIQVCLVSSNLNSTNKTQWPSDTYSCNPVIAILNLAHPKSISWSFPLFLESFPSQSMATPALMPVLHAVLLIYYRQLALNGIFATLSNLKKDREQQCLYVVMITLIRITVLRNL